MLDREPDLAAAPDPARERRLRVLALATFAIFFQAYMVAPLLPRLAAGFGVDVRAVGVTVPAYLIPYGVATLFYGLISDRLGRRPVLLGSLVAFVALTALTATARTVGQMVAWRTLTGLGASGVVPLALAWVVDVFPFERRGRPLGWLFGAMAGGAAFGSTLGAVLEPLIGWRALFLGVAAAGGVVLAALVRLPNLHESRNARPPLRARDVLRSYRALLGTVRGVRTYLYVFWNGIFHSGVFTWLGLYFARRYGLGEAGIGLALLGYGVPGLLMGPAIGRAADRWGRRRLVPAGLAVGAGAAWLLMPREPLWAAVLAVTVLSLGYDLTQPLLAGIVTALGGRERAGQAMGLNVFALFTGFGIGGWVFGEALRFGFFGALGAFGALQLLAAAVSVPLFRQEGVPRGTSPAST